MPATEMIVMVAVSAAILLGAIHLLQFAAVLLLHRTVRKVVDRNPELAESLLHDLTKPAPPSADDRTATTRASTADSLSLGEHRPVQPVQPLKNAPRRAQLPLPPLPVQPHRAHARRRPAHLPRVRIRRAR